VASVARSVANSLQAFVLGTERRGTINERFETRSEPLNLKDRFGSPAVDAGDGGIAFRLQTRPDSNEALERDNLPSGGKERARLAGIFDDRCGHSMCSAESS
jgi:hypothetical protein